MNYRTRKKMNTRLCKKIFKLTKKILPSSKISKLHSDKNYFYMNIKYKDVVIHIDNSLYKPYKILIEFEELTDKWVDWRVYHEITLNKDIQSSIVELKNTIDTIYSDYETHFTNSLVQRKFNDIDTLRDYLNECPIEYYKEFRNKELQNNLVELNIHKENIEHIKSCSDKIAFVKYQDNQYLPVFNTLIEDKEFNSFYEKAKTIKGYLEYDFEYIS